MNKIGQYLNNELHACTLEIGNREDTIESHYNAVCYITVYEVIQTSVRNRSDFEFTKETSYLTLVAHPWFR